jgi:hypothetical protein
MSDGMWWGTAIEAPDPAALANFYPELLGSSMNSMRPSPSFRTAGTCSGTLIALRRAHPVFRRRRFLRGLPGADEGFWYAMNTAGQMSPRSPRQGARWTMTTGMPRAGPWRSS